MWEVTERFRVKIGGTTFINCKTLVDYKGQSLFTLRRDDNGYLGIDFDIYDAKGNRVARVARNEIYKGDPDKYVIEETADTYILTDKESGDKICEIRKRGDANDSEIEIRYLRLFTPTGFRFYANQNTTNIAGATMIGTTIEDCGTGIMIT